MLKKLSVLTLLVATFPALANVNPTGNSCLAGYSFDQSGKIEITVEEGYNNVTVVGVGKNIYDNSSIWGQRPEKPFTFKKGKNAQTWTMESGELRMLPNLSVYINEAGESTESQGTVLVPQQQKFDFQVEVHDLANSNDFVLRLEDQNYFGSLTPTVMELEKLEAHCL